MRERDSHRDSCDSRRDCRLYGAGPPGVVREQGGPAKRGGYRRHSDAAPIDSMRPEMRGGDPFRRFLSETVKKMINIRYLIQI